MVGTVIGWFFAGLGILLLLLLLVPATVRADYSGGVFSLWVRVLFLSIRVLPLKKRDDGASAKPKKARRKKKGSAKEAGEEKPEKKRSVEDVILLVKRIAAAVGAGMRWVLRGMWVHGVELVIPVHAADAADTALNAARYEALVGGTRAVLESAVRVKYRRIVIVPDFAGVHREALHFSCKITAAPVIMLVACAAALLKFLLWKKRGYTLEEYKEARLAERRAASKQAEGAQK